MGRGQEREGKRKSHHDGTSTSGGSDNEKSYSATALKRAKGDSDLEMRIVGDDEHYFECVVCDNGGELLCCDCCPNTYHLYCLLPPLKRVPKGHWKCPSCIMKDDREKTGIYPQQAAQAEPESSAESLEGMYLLAERGSSVDQKANDGRTEVNSSPVEKARETSEKSTDQQGEVAKNGSSLPSPARNECNKILILREVVDESLKEDNKLSEERSDDEWGKTLKETLALMRAREKERIPRRNKTVESSSPRRMEQSDEEREKAIKEKLDIAQAREKEKIARRNKTVESSSSLRMKVPLGAEARKECLGKKAGTCWSDEELDSLWLGVRWYGQGEWTSMLTDPKLKFSKERVAEDLCKRWKREMRRIFKKEEIPPAVGSSSRKVVGGFPEGQATFILDYPGTDRMGFAGCSCAPGIQVGARPVDQSPRFQMGNASSPYWFPRPMTVLPTGDMSSMMMPTFPGSMPVLPTGVANARAQMFGGPMPVLLSGKAGIQMPAGFPFPNGRGMQTFQGPMPNAGGSSWGHTMLPTPSIFPFGMGTETFSAGPLLPPGLPTYGPQPCPGPMPVFPGGEGSSSGRRKTFPGPMPVSAMLPSGESYRITPTGLLVVRPNVSSQPNTSSSHQDASTQELFLGGAFKLKQPPMNHNQGYESSETESES